MYYTNEAKQSCGLIKKRWETILQQPQPVKKEKRRNKILTTIKNIVKSKDLY